MQGSKIGIVFTDWIEEEERGKEEELSHCSSVAGEGKWQWPGEEATEGGSH